MAQTGEELWIKVRDGLQAKLSKPTFETFIRPTGCSGFANGELKLLAPNPFASVRLREQLLPTIAEMASEHQRSAGPGDGAGGNRLAAAGCHR